MKPTQAQINAGLRYAGTAVASIGTIATIIGLLSADQAHALVAALQKFLTDLQQLIGDTYVIAGIIGPIAVVWLTRLGMKAASPASQVASLKATAPEKVAEAVATVDPKTLVAATQSLDAAQVIVTDPTLASPGVKVAPK